MRRSYSSSTGACAVAEIIKTSRTDNYSFTSNRARVHATLNSDAVDEPSDDGVVDMLQALDVEEAEFYSSEDNVIDFEGRSQTIFNELEEHFGFVGGTESEYVRYFHRANLPKGLGISVWARTSKPWLASAWFPRKIQANSASSS